MSNKTVQRMRLFFSQAWLGYHSRFSIMHPFGYFTAKFGFGFFLMIFFVFMGKYLGFSDPVYIVLGNILLFPGHNGMCGVTLAIGEERHWGTLSYTLGSPAPRLPIFIGRATFYILDGFLTAVLGLAVTVGLFHVDLSQTNFLLLAFCICLIAITSTGPGFLFGTIYLVSREGWEILSLFLSILFILVGVNFPVEVLPKALQTVAYGLPITRGLIAARSVLQGASFATIQNLIMGEAAVGAIYILIGYLFFVFIEKRSMNSGTIDFV